MSLSKEVFSVIYALLSILNLSFVALGIGAVNYCLVIMLVVFPTRLALGDAHHSLPPLLGSNQLNTHTQRLENSSQ